MSEPQQEASQDALMTRIGQAIMLHRGGDREEARNRLGRLWEETVHDGDPLHRCTIAHFLADTQDDPADELAWDLRALDAARALTEQHGSWHRHGPAVRSLYPSLHLNLAADHARLGDTGAARRELASARGTVSALAHDDYGTGVRAAIDRLEAQLAGTDQSP